VIVERDVHPRKQFSQICSTEEGIQIVESDEQSENAELPICDSSELDSTITLERVRHSAKHQALNIRTFRTISTSDSVPKYRLIELSSSSKRKCPFPVKLQFPSSIEISRRFGATSAESANCRSRDGRRIDESDKQSKNTKLSIHDSLESDSNVMVERDLHPRKQFSQICSTEEGIQIVESDEHKANAELSMNESLESDSNVIVARDVHASKQFCQSSSTEEGIQIVESEEQLQNALSSIHKSLESDSKVIVERDLHLWKQS
jgi:hypothetical protein